MKMIFMLLAVRISSRRRKKFFTPALFGCELGKEEMATVLLEDFCK